jgi:two-component system sensor histidine kinase KdpD
VRRRVVGLAVAGPLVLIVTLALVPVRTNVTRATPALLLVLPVVVAAVIGGRVSAVITAVVAAAAMSLVFIPPYYSYDIALPDDVVALLVFVAVALVVGTLVASEADRRRAAEERAEEIRLLHERYEAVVAERERLSTEANRLAVMDQVDQQRSALLRSVSHDLRTPLATICAVTSDLRAGAPFDPATHDALLELVNAEAERLNRIVENLLSLSRIEAGALVPERQPVALDELITNRVDRLARLFQDVVVRVGVPTDLPFVDADYVLLDLVVSNLLENAARYAPRASCVSVDASVAGDDVRVSVTDQGPGVDPVDRAHMFEPFRRGVASVSSGVGLAICRAVVEAHGGLIAYSDGPGGGARFTFTLPISVR